MEKVQFEKDETRYLIRIWQLQLAFYFDDWQDAIDRAMENVKTIEEFADATLTKVKEDNPFLWCYLWAMNGGDIALCLHYEWHIWIQVTTENIDYFDELSPFDLRAMADFLDEFINKCSKA